LWWKNECALTHGTNLSAGTAILFSPSIKAKFWKSEIEPGRVLAVKVDLNGLVFMFISVYAPNIVAERIIILDKLKGFF